MKTKIIDALKWRYATKIFDTDKKLSAKQLNMLFEALCLAPSSFGLQLCACQKSATFQRTGNTENKIKKA